jgi:uncharacterized membrane protein YfcA
MATTQLSVRLQTHATQDNLDDELTCDSHLAAAAVAAFLAGAINSVAGGGTLISFPTLIWLGLPSITANATSTVAIWPGTLGSIWGFRREIRELEPKLMLLTIPSFIGGAAGALLLRITPPALFDRLVPFLILFATILFTAQAPIQRHLNVGHHAIHRSTGWLTLALVFQLFVGLYGGYFGAGIGIMMLSALSILGMSDIHKMNALTSILGLCINGVAATLFIVTHLVQWHYVLVMAIAAVVGGYGAAGLARRVGRTAVRRFVIAVGFTIAVVLFIKMA